MLFRSPYLPMADLTESITYTVSILIFIYDDKLCRIVPHKYNPFQNVSAPKRSFAAGPLYLCIMGTSRNIREWTLPDLKAYFESIGDKKFRAMQTYEWLWKKNARDFNDMSNLSLELRKKLAEDFDLNTITVDMTQVSSDGTIKSRFKTHDNHLIEGVLISGPQRFDLFLHWTELRQHVLFEIGRAHV